MSAAPTPDRIDALAPEHLARILARRGPDILDALDASTAPNPALDQTWGAQVGPVRDALTGAVDLARAALDDPTATFTIASGPTRPPRAPSRPLTPDELADAERRAMATPPGPPDNPHGLSNLRIDVDAAAAWRVVGAANAQDALAALDGIVDRDGRAILDLLDLPDPEQDASPDVAPVRHVAPIAPPLGRIAADRDLGVSAHALALGHRLAMADLDPALARRRGPQLYLLPPDAPPATLATLADAGGLPPVSRGRGGPAPTAARLLVEAIGAVSADRRALATGPVNHHQVDLTLRELRDALWPRGWQRRRDLPRLRQALLDVHNVRVTMADGAPDWWPVTLALGLGDDPNVSLDARVRFTVTLPPDGGHGPRIHWPTLRDLGYRAPSWRLYLGLVALWYRPSGRSAWYGPSTLTPDGIVRLCFPDRSTNANTRDSHRARALDALDDLRDRGIVTVDTVRDGRGRPVEFVVDAARDDRADPQLASAT